LAACLCKVCCASRWLSGVLTCSPINPLTNLVPLVIVLAVSLAKEGFEDRKRRLKDREVCACQSHMHGASSCCSTAVASQALQH